VQIDCATPRLDGIALFESLALELQAQGIALRPLDAFKSDDNFVLEVRTDCDTRQQLVLRAARGVRSVEETFSLADVPRSAEPRTVALALAELLEDFRNERLRDGPATSRTAADEAAERATERSNAAGASLDLGPIVDDAFRAPPVIIQTSPEEPAEETGVRLLVMAGVEQRTFRLAMPMNGLDAGFSLNKAELGVSLLRGDVETSNGEELTTVVGNMAVGYRVAEVTNGRWTASVLPRFGIGSLVATTQPIGADQQKGTASELYGDVAARISVNALLWSRIGVTLNSEAGYGRGLFRIVQGRSTAPYTGLFLGVALLASLDFSSRKASRLWPPVSAKK
jgi:hypothetical protein